MKNFIYVAALALVMTACGANASKTEEAKCETPVATDIVPAAATDVLPAEAIGVATDSIPAAQ